MRKPQPGRYQLVSQDYIDLSQGPECIVPMIQVRDTQVKTGKYVFSNKVGLIPLDRLEALVELGLVFEPLSLPNGRILTFSDSEAVAEEARGNSSPHLVTQKQYAAVVAAADTPRRTAPSDRKRKLIRFDFYNRTGRYPTVEEWAELRRNPPSHLLPKLTKIETNGQERRSQRAGNRTNISPAGGATGRR
jgi:hypothetical protein